MHGFCLQAMRINVKTHFCCLSDCKYSANEARHVYRDEGTAALSGLQQATLMMVLQVEMLLHPALLSRQLLQQLWQAPWPRP